MSWQEMLRDAITESPVKGAPLKQPTKRPPPMGTTGRRPNWDPKIASEVINDHGFRRPTKDEPEWVKIREGKWIKVYKNEATK